MRRPLPFETFALLGCLLGGCAGAVTTPDPGLTPDGDAATIGDATGAGATCSACLVDTDCAAGGVCAQVAGDHFCLPPCSATGTCAGDAKCTLTANFAGAQVSVCEPKSGACSSAPTDGGVHPGVDSGTCGTLVSPTTSATCKGCKPTDVCQPNGCYGGWWCDTATSRCHAAPTTPCGAPSDGGVHPPVDSGPPPTGSVSAAGGTVSSLFFGIVGDTRPPLDDDTASYPTAIITSIYNVIATSTKPQFLVSTGDYMFAKPGGGEGAVQLGLYLGARAAYSGVLFPALGNHECTGRVTSNCGPSGADGITNNYQAFLDKMLAPIGQTNPYYSIRVDATDASWTAKFVFVAGNAWDSNQASWLDTALATPTTYTFVIRHEPSAANTAPGVTPSEAIMAAHPYTLAIVGHTHWYTRHYPREVVFGNGGAPLTGTSSFGFGTVTQRPDGAILVEAHDYATGAVDGSFSFALNADGTPAK